MDKEFYKPRNMRVKTFIARKMKAANHYIIVANGHAPTLDKGNMWIDRANGVIFRIDDDATKIECVSEWGIWQGTLETKHYNSDEFSRMVKDVCPVDDDALACADRMLSPEERK